VIFGARFRCRHLRFGNTIRFFQEYLSDKAAILAINDIRRRLYDHVLHVPMSFYGLKGTSDVTSRLYRTARHCRTATKPCSGRAFQMPINALFRVCPGGHHQPDAHTFHHPVCPGHGCDHPEIREKRCAAASRKALQNSSSMLGQIEGTLAGIRVVKGANAERFERRRYGRIMDGLTDEQTAHEPHRRVQFAGPSRY